MDTFHIPGQGIVLPGHVSRAEATAAARAYLIAQGWSEFDADEALTPRRNLVAQLWWGGDALGFVQEHHDGAAPVTVVNVAVQ